MTDWSLSTVFASLNDDIERRLEAARATFGHAVAKGDASQSVWLDLCKTYLPQRYSAASSHVVDSKGRFSDQIDLVVFDRQYTPFILNFEGQIILPAESVYAVFEAKQAVNAAHIAYAGNKVASVRALHRTSLPIPHAGGTYEAKRPSAILGGILSLDSEWQPPLGKALLDALRKLKEDESLDLGCVASSGRFSRQADSSYNLLLGNKPAAAFLFDLISRLQAQATVPMVDMSAYARWLQA